MTGDGKATRSAYKAVLAAEKARHEEWRDSKLRRSLVATFFGLLGTYVLAVVFYYLPLPVEGDTTMCGQTTTAVYAGTELKAESVTVERTCERRAIPSLLLAAGPALVLLPIVAFVFMRPGRASAKVTAGDDTTAEVVASDGLAALVENFRSRTNDYAQNFDGED